MAEINIAAADRMERGLPPTGRFLRLVPLLLALLFSLWGLRGATTSSIADDDAPRHALNGAFVFDMVRHGQLAHPVQYGYWYYSRLPALSLPYHPPVFPAFEAVIYSVVGVNAFAARLAVAITTFAAVNLLYRLVVRTHSSALLAALVTISFFALPHIQKLSATVMLEFPALTMVLAALWFVIPDQTAFGSRRSLYFALFAALAIWTKQTIFLFAFPFVYVVVSSKWRLLRRPYFWLTVSLIAASAIGLALLGRELQWNSINQSWARMSALQQLVHNAAYYLRWKILVGLLLLVLSLLTYRLPGGSDDFRRDRIYVAWFTAAILVLAMSPAYSYRYLFFAFAPFVVILYSGLARILRPWLHRYSWAIPAILTGAVLAYGLTYGPVELHGPAEAAKYLHGAGYRRVMFCGNGGNGAFIFAIRSVDPELSTIVIRGDKLDAGTFAPEQLNSFVRQYGVDSVVFERTANPQAWDTLIAGVLPFLSQERVVPMTDSDHFRDGTLSIYRVKEPTKVPETSLQIPISVLGRNVDLRF
jgi:hypothetical protein